MSTPTAGRKKSPPPDRNTKTPALRLPAGACDTHFHIFGPQNRFPLNPARILEVEDCTLEDLIALHDRLGISRGLIVQSFQHGYNYEYMLRALSRAPERFRGVIGPDPDLTDAELEILDRAGVVGMRFAFYSDPVLNVKLIHRIHELGWQAHFIVNGQKQIAAWREQILAVPGRFVLDHMANPPIANGLDGNEFRFLLESLETGRCWTKLSPRYSEQEALPFSDVRPFIEAVVERAPERLLWGSDWPHPHYFKPMPNDADLLDLMLDWVPDEAMRERIFVENPAELLNFPRKVAAE